MAQLSTFFNIPGNDTFHAWPPPMEKPNQYLVNLYDLCQFFFRIKGNILTQGSVPMTMPFQGCPASAY